MDDYQGWRGSAGDLIGIVNDREPEGEAISMAGFRFYQQSGVVGRGIKEGGNRATFTERELLEVLVARRLKRDGWPLAKSASLIGGMSVEALRAVVDGSEVPADRDANDDRDRARCLIESFMANSAVAGARPSLRYDPDFASSRSASGRTKDALRPVASMLYEMSAGRQVSVERNAFRYGTEGWLSLVFDPGHPSFDGKTQADALRHVDTAAKALRERISNHFNRQNGGGER